MIHSRRMFQQVISPDISCHLHNFPSNNVLLCLFCLKNQCFRSPSLFSCTSCDPIKICEKNQNKPQNLFLDLPRNAIKPPVFKGNTLWLPKTAIIKKKNKEDGNPDWKEKILTFSIPMPAFHFLSTLGRVGKLHYRRLRCNSSSYFSLKMYFNSLLNKQTYILIT